MTALKQALKDYTGKGEEGSGRLGEGLPAKTALREAGFPPSTVNLSRGGINSMIRAELMTLGRKYMNMGRDLKPEDQEAMVRGRLAENTVLGTDRGVLSAKQLGADRRISMWQSESQGGLVVLQAPPVRKIAHEVPLLPSEHPEEE